jgi:hydroxymethylpyrimidine/phosphomethylpyrimidine kinase
MLPNAAGIQLIAGRLARTAPRIPLVIDPVLVATSGAALTDEPAMKALKKHLFPLAVLVTPNLLEAAVLTGRQVSTPQEMEAAGREILKTGCSAVLMKGGHLSFMEMTDLLITATGMKSFSHPARPGSYHGTGCTLSAAITAGLARGETLEEAVTSAIDFVQDCIQLSRQPLKGQIRLLVCPGPAAR